jgi:hypothetical protein
MMLRYTRNSFIQENPNSVCAAGLLASARPNTWVLSLSETYPAGK